MKFVCLKDVLLEGISIVQKAVPSKSTVSVLEGILIECNDNLKLTGNDLEIGIECTVESDILEKGSIVINSKMFGDIIRKLPDAEIIIAVNDDNVVTIDCLKSHFELMGIAPDGYPSIPNIIKEEPYVINQKIIKDMIRQTIFSVSTDENKKVLNGSLIECHNNNLIFISVDGFRLSLRRNYVNQETTDFSAIVPGKTLIEIIKLLKEDNDNDNNVTIFANKSLIQFEFDNFKVVSRLIEGEFMNYKNILPSEFETRIKVNKKELQNSLERASLVTVEEKKFPVRFSILPTGLIIDSNTTIGNVREEVTIEKDGNDLEVGFNPKFFIDALKVIENEEIFVNFTSSVGPCNIKPLEGDSFDYMILPVRIKAED